MFNGRSHGAWMIALGVLLFAGCGEEDGPHVGSQDCLVIGQAPGAAEALCQACQGAPCESAEEVSCEVLPCVDGVRVAQGCDSDDDCAEFELPCGLYSSVHKMMCGTEAGDL